MASKGQNKTCQSPRKARNQADYLLPQERDDRRRICKLIKVLTTSGLDTLELGYFEELKVLCLKSDELVNFAYRNLFDTMHKDHSQIRLSSLQICDQLLRCSKLFRKQVFWNLHEIFPLIVKDTSTNKIFGGSAILPPPKVKAELLFTSAMLMVKQWYDLYGDNPKFFRLKLGYSYVSTLYEQETGASLHNAQALSSSLSTSSNSYSMKQASSSSQVHDLSVEEINVFTTELDGCLDEMTSTITSLDSCLQLLLPTLDDFSIDETENLPTDKYEQKIHKSDEENNKTEKDTRTSDSATSDPKNDVKSSNYLSKPSHTVDNSLKISNINKNKSSKSNSSKDLSPRSSCSKEYSSKSSSKDSSSKSSSSKDSSSKFSSSKDSSSKFISSKDSSSKSSSSKDSSSKFSSSKNSSSKSIDSKDSSSKSSSSKDSSSKSISSKDSSSKSSSSKDSSSKSISSKDSSSKSSSYKDRSISSKDSSSKCSSSKDSSSKSSSYKDSSSTSSRSKDSSSKYSSSKDHSSKSASSNKSQSSSKHSKESSSKSSNSKSSFPIDRKSSHSNHAKSSISRDKSVKCTHSSRTSKSRVTDNQSKGRQEHCSKSKRNSPEHKANTSDHERAVSRSHKEEHKKDPLEISKKNVLKITNSVANVKDIGDVNERDGCILESFRDKLETEFEPTASADAKQTIQDERVLENLMAIMKATEALIEIDEHVHLEGVTESKNSQDTNVHYDNNVVVKTISTTLLTETSEIEMEKSADLANGKEELNDSVKINVLEDNEVREKTENTETNQGKKENEIMDIDIIINDVDNICVALRNNEMSDGKNVEDDKGEKSLEIDNMLMEVENDGKMKIEKTSTANLIENVEANDKEKSESLGESTSSKCTFNENERTKDVEKDELEKTMDTGGEDVNDLEEEEEEEEEEELFGKNESGETLREMGILFNTNITITLPSDKVQITETSDNTDILENARGCYNLMKKKFLPLLQKWYEKLIKSKHKNSAQMKDALQKYSSLRARALKLIEKYEKMRVLPNSKETERKSRLDGMEDESEDSDDFEEVEFDEADLLPVIMAATTQDKPKQEENSRTINEKKMKNVEVTQERKRKREMEWSLRVSEMERVDPSSGHHHKSLIAAQATEVGGVKVKPVGQGTSKATEEAPHSVYGAFSERKRKLLALAPRLPYDTDLYHWEDETLPVPRLLPNSTEGHRFWSASALDDGGEGIPLPEGSALFRTRVIEFTGSDELAARACNVPLASGVLCPRRDKVKCPFHGIVYPRDAQGKCLNPEDEVKWQRTLEEKRKNQVPDWQDPVLLRELKAATGVDLTMPKKGQRRRVGPGPGLIKVPKPESSPAGRIKKKIFQKSSMRRVARALNKLDERKFRDKFGDQFNYT